MNAIHEIEIDAAYVKAGETGAGGWDVDVSFELAGATIEGEVTLLPHEMTGHPSSWGDLSHWASPEIIEATKPLAQDARRAVLNAIEYAACAAILASGIEAAKRE
jgi:hypothetical protein